MSLILNGTNVNSTINKMYLGNILVHDNTFDSGLLLNGVFDNSENVDFPNPPFSINGGIVSFSSGAANFTWDLKSDMLADTNYRFSIELLNGNGNSRFRVFVNQSDSFVEVVGNVTYSDNGTEVIDFTTPSGTNSTQLRLTTSSVATSFDFDNCSLKTI